MPFGTSYEPIMYEDASQLEAAQRANLSSQRNIQQAAFDYNRARGGGNLRQAAGAASALRAAIDSDIRRKGGRPEDLRYTGYVHPVPAELGLPTRPPAMPYGNRGSGEPQVVVIGKDSQENSGIDINTAVLCFIAVVVIAKLAKK